MAELTLEDQELYELAKSYLKNSKKPSKPARLYIRKGYKELKVAEGDPFKSSSSPNRTKKHDSIKPKTILKTEKLEEDFEDVALFYWKPDNKDHIDRGQLYNRLEDLRENITKYAIEWFYYCDHDYREVEEDGRSYRQCGWCDKVQYPVLQRKVDGETKSILTDTPDEVMKENDEWGQTNWMSKYEFLKETGQFRKGSFNADGLEISEEVE